MREARHVAEVNFKVFDCFLKPTHLFVPKKVSDISRYLFDETARFTTMCPFHFGKSLIFHFFITVKFLVTIDVFLVKSDFDIFTGNIMNFLGNFLISCVILVLIVID